MNEIRTSGPLSFTEPGCPTRVGEIINTLSEIYDIPTPRLGMQVFVKDEERTYIVTELKSKTINGVVVPNAQVNKYELLTGRTVKWTDIKPNDVKVCIGGNDNGTNTIIKEIPAATETSAGVMTAEDKRRLNGLRSLIENVRPVVYNNSTITNAPDEEDITTERGMLKLKDRAYGDGMGYVILRKDNFMEQIAKEKTIYEIRYDYDLGGNTISIPDDVVLYFNGGRFTNGSIVIKGRIPIYGEPMFVNISIDGTGYFDTEMTVHDTHFAHYNPNMMLHNAFCFKKSKLTQDYRITENVYAPHDNPMDLDMGYHTVEFVGDPKEGKNVGIYTGRSDKNYSTSLVFDNVFSIRNGKLINTSVYGYGGTASDNWKNICYNPVIFCRDYRSKRFENLDIYCYSGGIKIYLDDRGVANDNYCNKGGYTDMRIEYINCNIETVNFPIEGGWGSTLIEGCTLKRIQIREGDEIINPDFIPNGVSKESLIASLQNYGDYVVSQPGHIRIINSTLYGTVENGAISISAGAADSAYRYKNIKTEIHNCTLIGKQRIGVEDTNTGKSSWQIQPTSVVEMTMCRGYTGVEDCPSNYVSDSRSISIRDAVSVIIDSCYFEQSVASDAENVRFLSHSNWGGTGSNIKVINSNFRTNASQKVVYFVSTSHIDDILLTGCDFVAPNIALYSYRYFELSYVSADRVEAGNYLTGNNNNIEGRYEIVLGGKLKTVLHHRLFNNWYIYSDTPIVNSDKLPSYGYFGQTFVHVYGTYGTRQWKRSYGAWVPVDYYNDAHPGLTVPLGYSYFNTTVNKQLWFGSGSKWYDAAGNEVIYNESL